VRRALIAAALLATVLAAPAAAQDIGFNTWGLRAGAGDDPDQIVFGVQFDMGEFIQNLRFQPNVEVGVGDDATIVSLTAPVHYRVPLEGELTVYGGGGLTVGFIDVDEEEFDEEEDSDFDIAPMAAGGIAWPVGPSELSVELNLTAGDFSTVKLVVGWMF
jgi:hypothetical protein